MKPLEHFRLKFDDPNVAYFALNGHCIFARLFWMPMTTSEGREIKLPVIADQKVSGAGVKTYAKVPVLRVEHVSEDIVNRSLGIVSVLSPNVIRIVSEETPMAFAGTLPNVREAKEGDRFLVPFNVDVCERPSKFLHSPKVIVYSLHLKPFVKLASSYTDAISKELWDHALDVPTGMRWGEICKQVAEGRLSFPIKISPVYIDQNLESVHQDVVDLINARKLQ